MSGLMTGCISGVPSGLFVAFIVWQIQKCWSMRSLREKFGGISGTYKGYEFKNGQWELKTEPISEAKIKYEQDNILSITLTHELASDTPLTWEGFIAMEAEKYGALTFRYVKGLREGQLRSGFKRCIVEGNRVYLVGEETEGYGYEVLIRDRD